MFNLPAAQPNEFIETLHSAPSIRIERIISWGQASPNGFWYDQSEVEWVCVLSGKARLKLRDPDENVEMHPGDRLLIQAHRPHRVEWTSPDEPTVWLAVFYPP